MRAQKVVAGWMREVGLTVRTDAAGNVIGRREAGRGGTGTGKKAFVISSHLDTVPNAGKYDGILGVVAGIAIAELTRDMMLPFALEVVGFSEEEGVRFGKPYIGSHVYAGTLDETWLKLTDSAGISVEEAIRQFGIDPAPLRFLNRRNDLVGYLEIHIEQGPALERANAPVAAVRAIAGQTRMQVRLTGEARHAGTTPMELRRDALVAAADAILLVRSMTSTTMSNFDEELVATVGQIVASPNATNVIPGQVQLSVDVRHSIDSIRTAAVDELLVALENIGKSRRVDVEVVAAHHFPAVPMDAALTGHLVECVKAHTGRDFLLTSGAGHDAAIIASVGPSAMLFVRSPGGISHSPQESVAEEDVAVALAVACDFLRQIGT